MFAFQRVGTRRVHDLDFTQQPGWGLNALDTIARDLAVNLGPVYQCMDVRSGRYTLLQQPLPNRALMNALLPELNPPATTSRNSLIQLTDGALQQPLVFATGFVTCQNQLEIRQQTAFFDQKAVVEPW